MPTSKSKRKKPKQKSSIPSAKLPLLRYQGSMQFPLAGSQNTEDFYQQTTFTGDFKYANLRQQIFSKPRVYKFIIGIADTDGMVVDETEYFIDEALTKDELTQAIKQMSVESINDVADNHEYIDLTRSYIRIELCYTS